MNQTWVHPGEPPSLMGRLSVTTRMIEAKVEIGKPQESTDGFKNLLRTFKGLPGGWSICDGS